MFFKEQRQHHKEIKRVKGIPAAGTRGASPIDKRRDSIAGALVILVPLASIGAVAYALANRGEGDKTPDAPVTLSTSRVEGEEGYCAYPDMTTKPEQIEALQEELQGRDDIEVEVEVTGVYDARTIEAVREFQTEAQAYDKRVDGVAGFYTCMALGEPFYINE